MNATESREELVEEGVQDAFSRALTNLKATFGFERKVNLANLGLDYESKTASCYVQFDFPPDCDTLDEWLPAAQEAMRRAMSSVYDSLGIEVERDASGMLRELVRDFPGAVVVNPSQGDSTPAVAQSNGVGPTPPYSQEYLKGLPKGDELKQARKENAVWAEARYEAHPQEFYDNRQKKAADPDGWGSSPDFTHKKSRAGFYVD